MLPARPIRARILTRQSWPLPGDRLADTNRTITHEIISGERRWRASGLAGLATLPVMICDMTDQAVLECQIVENLQRDDLTELEEAEGYQVVMQAGALTVDALAAKIGKSRSYVFGRLKLLDLCIEARTSLRTGEIDFSRALLLARIPDHKLQIKALERIASKGYCGDLAMGYREAASYVQREYMLHLERAGFDILDVSLLPSAGSCKACSKRTGHEPDLFADVKSADVCTDPGCYRNKEEAHAARQLAQAHQAGKTVIEGREAKALWPNNWGPVEGYLRLDSPADSPTDQPLRKLLGQQLEASGVQTVLLKNPHKDNELIDMLPAATVAELLKATNHAAQGERIADRLQESKKHEAAVAKAKAKSDYEQAWRTLLLERTWAGIQSVQITTGLEQTQPQVARPNRLSDSVIRHLAKHYAQACNGDRARRLCQILELGKVAPKEALLDYVKTTPTPHTVLLLLIMHADVEYQPYMAEYHPGEPTNASLMLIADDYCIDAEKAKSDCKAALRAKLSKSTKPDTTEAQADQAKPRLVKRKLSAPEAQAAISAAMQDQDTHPGAGAQNNEEGPSQPVAVSVAGDPATASALAVDVRVRVTKIASRLPAGRRQWAGKEGVITQKLGDRGWLVAFDGRVSALTSFDASDLIILPTMTPRVAASQPLGRPIAFRGPNGETWSGRGLKPKWLTHCLENGITLEDLKVPA